MAVAWPTLSDLEAQLQAQSPLSGDKALIADRALEAAKVWIAGRLGLGFYELDADGNPTSTPTTIPENVHLAILLYAAKFYRRKDSPDGVAGMSPGEVGVIRTGRYDSDAESLLAGETLFIL